MFQNVFINFLFSIAFCIVNSTCNISQFVLLKIVVIYNLFCFCFCLFICTRSGFEAAFEGPFVGATCQKK